MLALALVLVGAGWLSPEDRSGDLKARSRLQLQLIHGDAPFVDLVGPAGQQKHLTIQAPNDGAVGMGVWGGPGKLNECSHGGFWIWEDGTIAFGGGRRSAGRTGVILKYDRAGNARFEFRGADESLLWQMPQKE